MALTTVEHCLVVRYLQVHDYLFTVPVHLSDAALRYQHHLDRFPFPVHRSVPDLSPFDRFRLHGSSSGPVIQAAAAHVSTIAIAYRIFAHSNGADRPVPKIVHGCPKATGLVHNVHVTAQCHWFGDGIICLPRKLCRFQCLQYVVLALAYANGWPYRKAFYTNFWLVGALVVSTGFALYAMIEPDPTIRDWL